MTMKQKTLDWLFEKTGADTNHVEALRLPDGDSCPEVENDDRDMADYHLVDKVFSRLNYCDVMICLSEEYGVYWRVTVAHGEIWYRAYELWDFGNDFCANCVDWGHFPEDDYDAMDALADAIAVAIENHECSIDYDPALFDVLGIEVEETAE